MKPLVSILALLGAVTGAAAGGASFTASRDVTLVESSGSALADGAGEHMRVGNTNQSGTPRRRGLIRFDLAGAIPAGARILGVTLILHESGSNAAPAAVTLHRALEDWGEGPAAALGGSGAPAGPGDATWLHRFHNPAAPATSPAWDSPGGDFTRSASASTLVAGAGYYSWTSPQTAEDVRLWREFPAANAGWLILGDESGSQTVKRFDSRENPDALVRPLLIIEFAAQFPGRD